MDPNALLAAKLATPEGRTRLSMAIHSYIRNRRYNRRPLMSLTLDEYQIQSRKTAIYPKETALAYVALGLNGEAGEVAEHAKKALRDDGGIVTEDRKPKMAKEIGDTLWYLAQVASELGLSLGDIAQGNLDKLASRKERGVLQGSGDDR